VKRPSVGHGFSRLSGQIGAGLSSIVAAFDSPEDDQAVYLSARGL
jgi:hypothetical protein